MMKIEVFGPGCAKCKRLEKNVRKAVEKGNIDAEVVKIEDINEIAERGVFITPALFVDGKKMVAGAVPKPDAIIKMLK